MDEESLSNILEKKDQEILRLKTQVEEDRQRLYRAADMIDKLVNAGNDMYFILAKSHVSTPPEHALDQWRSLGGGRERFYTCDYSYD